MNINDLTNTVCMNCDKEWDKQEITDFVGNRYNLRKIAFNEVGGMLRITRCPECSKKPDPSKTKNSFFRDDS